jgi:hypothetical protein
MLALVKEVQGHSEVVELDMYVVAVYIDDCGGLGYKRFKSEESAKKWVEKNDYAVYLINARVDYTLNIEDYT